MSTDKLNRVDFRWFVVRTPPRQESKLVAIIEDAKPRVPNILEVYSPAHTRFRIQRAGGQTDTRLFPGLVFVLATREALTTLLETRFPTAVILYDYRLKVQGLGTPLLTIPDEQMRRFRDFNENYAEQVIILERPYSDYAFNPKTNQPNEIVRVIDGPLAGREGYLCKFHRDKRIVFQMRGFDADTYFTISLPQAWHFHVVRLHNAEGDRLSLATQRERAADLLIGILQACGYGERTLPVFCHLVTQLAARSSFTLLRQDLDRGGELALSDRLARLTADEARLVLTLARYERENPGYLAATFTTLVLRPFLTPSPGLPIPADESQCTLQHAHFTELIRRVPITEEVYYPSQQAACPCTTDYYAHVGILPPADAAAGEPLHTLFVNWHEFLDKYYRTADKAREKLLVSFATFAPALHQVLTDPQSPVHAVPSLAVGDSALHALVIQSPCIEPAAHTLITTCVRICQQLNTTTHLSEWRRYLRHVWLHQ